MSIGEIREEISDRRNEDLKEFAITMSVLAGLLTAVWLFNWHTIDLFQIAFIGGTLFFVVGVPWLIYLQAPKYSPAEEVTSRVYALIRSYCLKHPEVVETLKARLGDGHRISWKDAEELCGVLKEETTPEKDALFGMFAR